ncbi:hypothetical protein VEHBASIW_CDS0061 [Salmonella phage vB_SalP_QS]
MIHPLDSLTRNSSTLLYLVTQVPFYSCLPSLIR